MKKSKGITLIALVITIVILIILAGVGINVAIGENGIFTKAKEAKKAQVIAETKEKIGTEILAAQIEAIARDESLEEEQVKDIISNYGELQEDGDTIILKDIDEKVSLLDIYNGTTVTSGSYSENKAKIELLETQVATLEQQLEDFTLSESDAKTLIASAISKKGITTTANDTFETMVENIGKIKTVVKIYTINNRDYASWYPTETVNVKSVLPNDYTSLTSASFILNARRMDVHTVTSCNEAWNYSFSYNSSTGVLTIYNPLYYASGHGYYQLSSFDIYAIIP